MQDRGDGRATNWNITPISIYLLILNLALIYVLLRIWPQMIPPPPEERVALLWGGGLTFQLSIEVRYLLIAAIMGAISNSFIIPILFPRRHWEREFFQEPFIGMALGSLAYFTVQGVVLPSELRTEHFSPWGIAVIGALAGLFTPLAINGIRAIANMMFARASPFEPGGDQASSRDLPAPALSPTPTNWISEPEQSHFLGDYIAGLSAVAIAVPSIMIVVTLVAYIGWWPGDKALLLGIFGGLSGWLLLALLAQYFARVDRAHPAVYRELRARSDIAREQMEWASEFLRRYENQEQREKEVRRTDQESREDYVEGGITASTKLREALREGAVYLRNLDAALRGLEQ